MACKTPGQLGLYKMHVVRPTNLSREGIQGSSLNGVDRKFVVGVNGSEASRNLIKVRNDVPGPQGVCVFLPNHLFEAFPDSMTSTTPGRRGSIEGT